MIGNWNKSTYTRSGDGTISKRISTRHVLNLYDALSFNQINGLMMQGTKSIMSMATYGASKLLSFKLDASHKLTATSMINKMQSNSKHINHSTTPRKLLKKEFTIRLHV